VIVVAEPLPARPAAWLAERATVHEVDPRSPAAAPALAETAGLVVRTATAVDRSLLDRMPGLSVVGRAGVGLDNIDVPACRSRGISVVYTPHASTQAVVEYVFALLLDLLRPRPTLAGPVARTDWEAIRRQAVAPHQLSELTVGILGLGRIGRRVAEVASALGSPVLYNDLLEVPPPQRGGAEPVPVEELFSRSEVLTLHIDGRPSNRHFVGASLLGQLRPGAVLVNTCRGSVVDAGALARWLAADERATAVLDVHEPEPIDAGYPLLGLPNARLLPHLASRTATAVERMGWVARDVVAVLDGRAPQHPAPC
jgi:phosphoglycerate dehydrogenase-like enzyme